ERGTNEREARFDHIREVVHDACPNGHGTNSNHYDGPDVPEAGPQVDHPLAWSAIRIVQLCESLQLLDIGILNLDLVVNGLPEDLSADCRTGPLEEVHDSGNDN